MKSLPTEDALRLLSDDRRPDRAKVYRFGAFELSTLPLKLSRSGESIDLQPQPARALKLLIEHRGRIVTREMLRDHLWGKGTFLDHEQGINFALRKIRIALGDSPSSPRFVETVPRRGYRFVASVDVVDPASSTGDKKSPRDARPQETKTPTAPNQGTTARKPGRLRRPVSPTCAGRRHRELRGPRCRNRL